MENEVLKIIEKNNITFDSLLKVLNIEKETLNNILEKLLKEKKIFINSSNRYEYMSNEYIIAKLERCSKGFYYVKYKNEKIKIHPEELHTALKNDEVIINLTQESCGSVIGIVERKNNRLVCEVKEKNNKLVLVPFNGNCEISIMTPKKELLTNLIIGDRVYITLDNSIDNDNVAYANSITKIGHYNDDAIDEISIAISKDFDIDFSDETMKEVENTPNYVTELDKENRLDLTKEKIFTIDSIHTKDMDDAVSIKKLDNGNYLLGVHIADVPHYVKPKSALFKEALKRGTSLYLGEKVIPMIPNELSNGICSLNEGEIRLTKSVFIEITPKGKTLNEKIVDSYIKSNKKMTYEELNEYFKYSEIDSDYLPFINEIDLMRKLSNILTKIKNKQGNLEFENNELFIRKELESDKVIEFEKRDIGEAQKIIENFMILANETVATYFKWRELPFIYRVHGNPDELKIENTIELINSLGYRLVKLQNAYGIKAIQNILNDYKDTKEYSIISNLLLRSMQKAKYSTENTKHYALASDCYCHFTSPIRRFPDLIVHSLIDIFIKNNNQNTNIKKIREELISIADHSSYKERQANDAEIDYAKLKMAKYMQEHINEEFTGIIIDIDKDKAFIKLDNNIKGILDLGTNASYGLYLDTYNKEVRSNYSKLKIKLGTPLLFKVTSVDIPQKEVYLEIKEIIKDNNHTLTKKLEI